MGLRADTTPQVARIDAHLLNRQGVTRLCYCGPVLHTRPDRPHATREPLQFGAEIYGHAGLEADIESLRLALDCLQAAGMPRGAHRRPGRRAHRARACWPACTVDAAAIARVHAALAAKDASELRALTRDFPAASREGLLALVQLYGDATVLDEAARRCRGIARRARRAGRPAPAGRARSTAPRVSFDLADLRGYAYYSGMRFGIYVPGAADALVRGGRYDEVGAVFGRNRPGRRLQPRRARTGRRAAGAPAARRHPRALARRRRPARRHRATAQPGRDRGLRAAGPRQRDRRIPLRPRARRARRPMEACKPV